MAENSPAFQRWDRGLGVPSPEGTAENHNLKRHGQRSLARPSRLSACFARGSPAEDKEGLELTKWYAQEHVLLCLVPALVLAAVPVAILSFVFPSAPLIPFIMGWAGLAALCARTPGEGREWLDGTWTLGKQIFPLLIGGVFVSGMLLGRPQHEGLIPSE